jgi:hypothetical protein
MSKKIKLQIISWLNGSVLFEYEAADNTISKTVEEAIKRSADLRYADLRSDNLSYANLSSADLRYANLSSANLSSANLSSADLRSADLSYADLSSADLSSADLRSADLRSANLSSAYLSYANLRSDNLSYAKNAKLVIAMTRILPEGDIIGWKKCQEGVIVKLLIPAGAKRSHAFGRKCRAEYAEVLKLYKAKGKKEATSVYDSDFKYKIGETVKPTEAWNEDFTNECGSGIHFFINREEAENHVQ